MVGHPKTTDALIHLRARLEELDRDLGRFKALLHEKDCLEEAICSLEKIGGDRPVVPIWYAAKEFLVRKGKPMTAKQITDAVLAAGVRIEGKTPMESVRVALTRKTELIERLTDGRFQLREGKQELPENDLPHLPGVQAPSAHPAPNSE
jgi:hypothetical protein